jgi:UDP-N-acetyl-D-glucosamine dehydrogenase
MSIKQEIIRKLHRKLLDKTAKVSILGLGYVGLLLAVVFADAGFDVTGVDLDERKVQMLNAGQSYIEDVPGDCVQQLVKAGRLGATSDFSVLKDADLSFIVSVAEKAQSSNITIPISPFQT